MGRVRTGSRRPAESRLIPLPEDEDRWVDLDVTDPGEIVGLLRPYPADLITASLTDT